MLQYADISPYKVAEDVTRVGDLTESELTHCPSHALCLIGSKEFLCYLNENESAWKASTIAQIVFTLSPAA